MTQVTGKTRQLTPASNPYLVRSPFVHPNDYRPGIDPSRWRVIAGEPVNKMARRMIQREVASLNWRIRPSDNEDPNQRAAALYYAEVFRDFRMLASRALKGVCELPQGGAWEVVWMPSKFEEARGTVASVTHIDAATLHPTAGPNSKEFPIIMIDPMNSLRRVKFRDENILRLIAHPRDEFDLAWWQEAPTEASYLQIEALARLYTFSLKKLLDTPPVGILDLMDFSAETAKKWAESFRETIEGIDPIKIPVLYEHDQPAQYISLSNDFEGLKVDEQFQRYAELVLANYGLSIDDLRIFGHSGTKAGMAVSQKTTLRSGISFFAELVKDAVQSLLPDTLIFEYSEPDIDEERSKAQVRAADARTLATMPWLPTRYRVELAKLWGLLGDLELDPKEIEKEAEENAEKLAAQTSPPGAGGTGVPKTAPGHLERGEGRIPNVLEDEDKTQAARGSRIFARSDLSDMIEKATQAVRDFYPREGQRYGRKKALAADRFDKLLRIQFRKIGERITPEIVGFLLDAVYTQFPPAVQELDTEPPQTKAWTGFIEKMLADDYTEKIGEREAEINALLDDLLAEAAFYSLSDAEFLARALDILALAYEDGLLGASEVVQGHLHSRGLVSSPNVRITYRLTDPLTIRLLGEFAADFVQNVDSGTKYYLRNMITEGAVQGLSADELTDRIKVDLFGLPPEEAAKLPEHRIRSIVNTELNRADSQGRLAQMKAIGLKLKRWITRLVDVCDLCLRNEALGSVDIDYEFETVFRIQEFKAQEPPGHPTTCHCQLGMDQEELDQLTGVVEFWDGGPSRPEKAALAPLYPPTLIVKYHPGPYDRYPAGSDVIIAGRRAGGMFRFGDGKKTAQTGKKTVSTNGKKTVPKKPSTGETAPKSTFRETDAKTYLEQRAKTEFANMLTPYTEKELAESGKEILRSDGVLYLLDDGDIQGVVNVSGRRGAGRDAIIDAIVRGGETLDCYAGFLDSYYAKFGFVETERLKFDPQYAPENWDIKRFDNPDVVFMEYPKGLSRDPEEVRKRFESAGERAKSDAGRFDRPDGTGRRSLFSRPAGKLDRRAGREVGPPVPGLRQGADRLHPQSALVDKYDPEPARDQAGKFTFKPQTKRPGKHTAGDLYFMVKFRSTQAIERMADYARENIGTIGGVKWEPPSRYHTTLVFLPDVPKHMVPQMTEVLKELPSIPLDTDGFGTFSTERGDQSNVLYLKVRRTPELLAMFEKVHEHAKVAGVKISEFSNPATWTPHITLAYAEIPFDESLIPEVGGVGLGSLNVTETVDRRVQDQSEDELDVFEPVTKARWDERHPAGSEERDRTGDRVGGQFRPQGGTSAVAVEPMSRAWREGRGLTVSDDAWRELPLEERMKRYQADYEARHGTPMPPQAVDILRGREEKRDREVAERGQKEVDLQQLRMDRRARAYEIEKNVQRVTSDDVDLVPLTNPDRYEELAETMREWEGQFNQIRNDEIGPEGLYDADFCVGVVSEVVRQAGWHVNPDQTPFYAQDYKVYSITTERGVEAIAITDMVDENTLDIAYLATAPRNLKAARLTLAYDPVRGAGTALMMEIVKDAVDENLDIVGVARDNAVPFYEALGAEQYEVQAPGEDVTKRYRVTVDKLKPLVAMLRKAVLRMLKGTKSIIERLYEIEDEYGFPLTGQIDGQLEKYDDDPNREPAGTTKTDSTGGKAGGQFAEKDGKGVSGKKAPEKVNFNKLTPEQQAKFQQLKEQYGNTISDEELFDFLVSFEGDPPPPPEEGLEQLQIPGVDWENYELAYGSVERWLAEIRGEDEEDAFEAWKALSDEDLALAEETIDEMMDFDGTGAEGVEMYQDGKYDAINYYLRGTGEVEDLVDWEYMKEEAEYSLDQEGIGPLMMVEYEEEVEVWNDDLGEYETVIEYNEYEEDNPDWPMILDEEIERQAEMWREREMENVGWYADQIDEAMTVHSVPQPIVTYRGTNPYHFGIAGAAASPEQIVEQGKDLVGTVWADEGFSSSSLSFDFARGWGNLVLEMQLPEGTRAIWLGGDDDLSGHGSEQEVLLDREQRYVIVDSYLKTREQYTDVRAGPYPVLVLRALRDDEELPTFEGA